MKQLIITERYGQYTVTTSDGRKAVGATLAGAVGKVFAGHLVDDFTVFDLIKPTPEAGTIREGVQGA